ncbi:MAG: hypothetical protein NZ901_12865 [Geminocystis sp.]|nr:hypothetical protein [Geminocystis sp.]HIK38084.1 hypothetical protein [Geminocystis sp. M7585_C2015_104]MCS7149059.1 hypothetical protein [Geminocystis sp.]MCX8077424.1 hypothetical protein [Geminocystis sp.]MDW8117136.1 hypothetical protein [Geminocystis sp.]
MELLKTIHWEKLAEIKELKNHFSHDFDSFQNLIVDYITIWSNLDKENLDKLAILRALEVTNGCTQWAYRRGDKDCLPIEKTRKCMSVSMSSIKNKRIYLKSETITFPPEIARLIDEGRSLYIQAFKNNLPEKEREFYALSTAQFLVYGRERMNRAFDIIQENFGDVFTEFFINKGRRYVQPYLEAIGEL